MAVATVREKYLENEFFSRPGKFVNRQGNLERTWKVREICEQTGKFRKDLESQGI